MRGRVRGQARQCGRQLRSWNASGATLHDDHRNVVAVASPFPPPRWPSGAQADSGAQRSEPASAARRQTPGRSETRWRGSLERRPRTGAAQRIGGGAAARAPRRRATVMSLPPHCSENNYG
jgi:hypothetical protein